VELRVNIVLPHYMTGPLLLNIMASAITQISFGSQSRLQRTGSDQADTNSLALYCFRVVKHLECIVSDN